MTNKLLTSVAAGAIFLGAAVAPVAFAQDTTQPSTNQTMEDPATTPEAGSTDTGTMPADDSAATETPEATPDTDTAQTPAEDPATDTAQTPADDAATDTAAAAGDTYLTEQAEDQISANTFIGQSVYNNADESIGNIADLIIKKEGGIDAAVIGVGGFLGIGEKWVAVPFQNITVNQVPDTGEVKLTTTETAESLEAAPEFKTLSQKMAEQNAATPVDSGTTSSTTGAGGMTPAPAE